MKKNSNRFAAPARARELFPLMEALAVAVAVDRNQGFIKSKQGYHDQETDTVVHDNRVVALATLRHLHSAPGSRAAEDTTDMAVVLPTQEDHAAAQEIWRYFDEIIVMEKLTDSLVKTGRDGRVNDYNLILSSMFTNGSIDGHKELAMIVSLPNSRRISAVREEMTEFYRGHSNRGYIGSPKDRLKITGRVVDVKFIPRHQIHLATVLTTDGQLAKFFMNDNLSDVAKRINGNTITFVGTVKKHEVNDFTTCQETMFNRVKID